MTQTGITANQSANMGRPIIGPKPKTHSTFSNQLLHPERIYSFNHFGYQAPRGFGLDLNGDGKFDSNKDGFLTFDFNRDGKHTDHEIQHSRNILKAFTGDFDSNADGRVDYNEYWQGFSNWFQARSLDLDGNGILASWELQRAGAGVATRNDNRRPGEPGWKSHRLDSLPGMRSFGDLNPWNGTFTTTFNWSLVARS